VRASSGRHRRAASPRTWALPQHRDEGALITPEGSKRIHPVLPAGCPGKRLVANPDKAGRRHLLPTGTIRGGRRRGPARSTAREGILSEVTPTRRPVACSRPASSGERRNDGAAAGVIRPARHRSRQAAPPGLGSPACPRGSEACLVVVIARPSRADGADVARGGGAGVEITAGAQGRECGLVCHC
jgi:hypothetical protein